jgi:hypothetical protein
MSKGSSPRPFKVTNEEYSNRWDAIFGQDNEKNNKTQALESDRQRDPCDCWGSDNPEGQAGQTKDA